MKKKYILTLLKPSDPPIDFPIRIDRRGWLGYEYALQHSVFYATKLNYVQVCLHIIVFRMLSSGSKLRKFRNRKAFGKLIVMEIFPGNGRAPLWQGNRWGA